MDTSSTIIYETLLKLNVKIKIKAKIRFGPNVFSSVSKFYEVQENSLSIKNFISWKRMYYI